MAISGFLLDIQLPIAEHVLERVFVNLTGYHAGGSGGNAKLEAIDAQ